MIIRGIVIFSFLFSTFCFAQSNKLAVDSIYNSKKSTAIKLNELIVHLNTLDTILPSENAGYLLHKIGLLHHKKNDLKQAITVTKKAVLNRFLLKKVNTLKLNNSLFNLYVYYKNLKELDSCKNYLIKIIANNGKDKFTGTAYRKLAYALTDSGDHFKALEYLEGYFYFVEKTDDKNIIKYHQTCIYVYSKMEDFMGYESSISHHINEFEKFSNKIITKSSASTYNNCANYFDGINKSSKAILYYKRALEFYISKNDSINIGTLYNNIGAAYAKGKNFKKSQFYFQKGLIITKNKSIWADIYDNQGFYLQTKNPIDKINFYKKAINCFIKNENFNNDYSLNLLSFNNPSDRLDVVGYLVDLANEQVIAYESNGNIDFLKSAKKNILLVDKLVSSIRSESSAEKSKLFWINNGVDTYMLGVKICFLLHDLDTAFYFMEKNKSLLLLENISHNSSNKNLKIASLKECINKLVSNKSCFVEYILNENDGYGIFYANNSKFFFRLNNVNLLLKNVKSLKSMCTKPFKTENDFNAFNSLSHTIFKTLFSFDNSLSFISKKKLTVISDFKLQNLAFETLNSSLNRDNNFLILNTEISYLQSFSVLNQILKKNRNAPKDILAIAPTTFNHSSLVPLPDSIENILFNTSFSKTILHNNYATKDTFFVALNNYKIIHINTHAGIDSKNKTPWIAFWDKKLFLQDLYKNKNQADLIILDACNSASGDLAVGEGVLSLSRGFFLTGTKSVIASLWNVNVKSTNNILASFYNELSNNNSKSNALHIAKLNYLKSAQGSEKSPYYWASIILTGDFGFIKLDEKKSLFPFLLLSLLPIIIFIYKRFYSKK